MRYTRRHTDPSLSTDASLIEILWIESERHFSKSRSKASMAACRRDCVDSPAREVFAAVEQTGRTVQGVSRIIDGRAFFGRFMGSAQENPLLGGGHLGAGGRLAMRLKAYG